MFVFQRAVDQDNGSVLMGTVLMLREDVTVSQTTVMTTVMSKIVRILFIILY